MVQSSNLLEMIPPSTHCPTSSSLEYYTLKTPNKKVIIHVCTGTLQVWQYSTVETQAETDFYIVQKYNVVNLSIV